MALIMMAWEETFRRFTRLYNSILLKKKSIYCFFALVFLLPSLSMAQYYIRGEVKDEKGNGLQNVKIILNSTGLPYSTGVGGAFGILTSKASDSLSLVPRRLRSI